MTSPLPPIHSSSITMMAIDMLRPHPQNYQTHSQDELDELKASITEHGIYKNVVATRSGVLLARHGVVEAATQLGIPEIPVYVVDYEHDDSRAIRGIVSAGLIHDPAERIYNIGNTEEKTVFEWAEKIIALSQSSSPIFRGTIRPIDDPNKRCPDIRRDARILNWHPEISADDGLAMTIAWYQKQHIHNLVHRL